MSSLRLPVGLLALLVLELLVVPRVLEPRAGSLEEAHRRANFGAEPERLELADFLGSEDPLWRDFAMTWDLTRAAGGDKGAQRSYLDEGTDTPASYAIGDFFLRYQVKSPDLAAIETYYRQRGRRAAAEVRD